MKPYSSLLRGVNETIHISTQGCNETIHISTQGCQWNHTYLYSGVSMEPYISLLRGVNGTIQYSGVSIEPYTSLLRSVNGTIRIYSFTLTINDRKQISTDNTSLISKILSVHYHIETMFKLISFYLMSKHSIVNSLGDEAEVGLWPTEDAVDHVEDVMVLYCLYPGPGVGGVEPGVVLLQACVQLQDSIHRLYQGRPGNTRY